MSYQKLGYLKPTAISLRGIISSKQKPFWIFKIHSCFQQQQIKMERLIFLPATPAIWTRGFECFGHLVVSLREWNGFMKTRQSHEIPSEWVMKPNWHYEYLPSTELFHWYWIVFASFKVSRRNFFPPCSCLIYGISQQNMMSDEKQALWEGWLRDYSVIRGSIIYWQSTDILVNPVSHILINSSFNNELPWTSTSDQAERHM